ncbi:MAG: DUF3784 domain-containing protein [Bacteroides sp.]|nr:DUF3784 domain-containing protein [Bacteroides sp.]
MEESSLTGAIVLFSASIGCFILAYLYFTGKLSVRWRSGYFYAPKDEQKQPDFKVNSKVQAFIVFLGGVAGILLGFYQLFHEKWIRTTVMVVVLVILLLGVFVGLIIGKEKHRSKRHFSSKKKSLEKGRKHSFRIFNHRNSYRSITVSNNFWMLCSIAFGDSWRNILFCNTNALNKI